MSLNEPGLAGPEPLRGGPEALQKVGLSLKDDGAAGTCPGNASACSEAWRHAWVASSEQPLRGLLRPRPRSSRLPFGEPYLSSVSPEACPARPSLARAPHYFSPLVRAGVSGNHSFPVGTGVRPYPLLLVGGPAGGGKRGAEMAPRVLGAPGPGTDALLNRAGGISPRWGKFPGVSVVLFYVRWSRGEGKIIRGVGSFCFGSRLCGPPTFRLSLSGFPTGQ